MKNIYLTSFFTNFKIQGILALALLLFSVGSYGQTTITWSGTTSSSWLTTTNWTGGVFPGSKTTSTNNDIAYFNNTTNGATTINMATQASAHYLGALNFGTGATTARSVANSSATTGTMYLNGVTLNSIANTIIWNQSNKIQTFKDVTSAMNLGLNNTTDNVIQITGTAGVTISSIISGVNKNLTKDGTGAGVLLLTAPNTYTGKTTITAGTLQLNPSANTSLSGACAFNGGTLSTTGIASIRTITFSAIDISNNSTLVLASATNHTLTFTAKGTFTAGKTLTITGWTGSYILGTTGAVTNAAKVFIGNTAVLTAAELAQIKFNDGTTNYAAAQLSTGEIVPTASLVVTTIPNQSAGFGFDVIVSSKDLDGNLRALTNATGITLTTTTGGTIGGTTTGTITAGSNTVTITGVTLTAGLTQTITASRSSGDKPIAGISNSFDVISNKISVATGNWNAGSTWFDGIAPSSTDSVIIQSSHIVTNTTTITRDAGTTTTVNVGGTLATDANYSNNGTTIINGTFQLNQGSWAGGTTNFTYGAAGTLTFNNSSGSYGANNGTYWPAASGPFNVNITGAGGVTMGFARTINGTLTVSAPITTASFITVNSICQINNTAATMSDAIVYGATSTLVYNVNATMGRGNEWNNSPANVTLQNNSLLNYPNGWGAITRTLTGNLTIGASSGLYMDYGSPATGVGTLTVGGNVALSGNLSLGNQAGGDLVVGGNWTNSATFAPNGRSVTFNGTAAQSITNTSGETFAYLINNKASGTLTLANNVTVTASSGDALQLLNTGAFNLNGKSLTLSNTGGNILVSGATRTISSGVAGATINITGTKTVTTAASGSLVIGANITTLLTAGLDCGVGSLTTISKTLQLNAGGYVFNNAPKYGVSSLLQYNSGANPHNRQLEWSADIAAIGTVGLPTNVQISNATTLNYNNAGNSGAKGVAGSLTIDAGSSLYMDYGSVSSGGVLTISGNLVSAGNMTLGFSGGDDLKIGGNITFNAGYSFDAKNRAVIFTKAGTQTITASSKPTFHYVNLTSGMTTVQLSGTDLDITAPLTGNVISFSASGDTFDINGKTLTLGTTLVANAISGTGTFKGSTTSNLSLLGTGSIGTINFTASFQNLGTLVINRQAATVACVLGTALTINSALTLTNGIVDLGANTMTLTSACSNVFGDSANSFVISDVTAASNLRKNVTATATTYRFPIGDKTGTIEYSPATVTFTAGSFASAYVGLAVQDFALTTDKHPSLNATTDYISRYWTLTNTGTFTTPTYTVTANYLATDVNGTEANCSSNQWNGTTWSDAGNTTGTNTLMISGITTLPATNHITKAKRDPSIAITPATLSGFTYVIGIGPSTSQSYAVSGLNLLANIVLTAPADYQICLTPTGTYVSSLSLIPSTGTVASTTVYIRLKSGLLTETYNGELITATSTGAPQKDFTCNGSVTLPVAACYLTDFDSNGETTSTKPSYPGAEVTLENGIPWLLDTCLIFNSASDYATSGFSVRFKSSLSTLLEMDQDQTDGIGTIIFNYKNYSGSVSPSTTIYTVEYSKDAGNSWTNIGNITPTDALQVFSYTLNQSGPVRIHIKYFSGISDGTTRFNIDNISLCNYSNSKEIEITGNNTTIANAATASLTNDTDFGTDYFVGDAPIIKTYTVTNRGIATLNLTSLSVSNATNFTISSPLSSTALAPGESATFSLSFSTTDTGLKSATVTLLNDDADEGTYTFNVASYSNNYIKCAMNAMAVIAQQDFEIAPATPILTFTASTTTSSATLSQAGGTNYGDNVTTKTNMFIGAQSYQVKGKATVTSDILSFATTDVSAYKNISLSFNLGAYGTSAGNGLETKDQVFVSISEDGGTTWHQQMIIGGNNNSIWDINTATGSPKSRKYDSTTSVSYGSVSNSVNTFSSIYSITNLPNSTQLKVKFEFKYTTAAASNANEIFALDNVKLEGQTPQTTTWSLGAWSASAPTNTKKAIFDGNYTTATDGGVVEACECEIKATRTVTVSPNEYLEVQSDLKNSGTLTIENNGSLVQANDNAVNTGIIDFKRTTTDIINTDYTYWSSPIAGLTIDDVYNGKTKAGMYYSYDATADDWHKVTAATTMVAGTGYIIRGPEPVFPSPPVLGTYSAVLTGTPNNGLFTTNGVVASHSCLLGNPYPSAIDADKFLAANAAILDGTLYFWTHNTAIQLATNITNGTAGTGTFAYTSDDYAVYNGVGGVATLAAIRTGVNNTIPNGEIAAGQGFFATALTSGSVVFNDSMRLNSLGNVIDNSQFFRTKNPKLKATNTIEKHRIWLDLTNTEGVFKQTLIGYITDATNDFENRFDGLSFNANAFADFYSVSQGNNLVIQGRALPFDPNDLVPLGFKTTIEGTFSINIDQADGVLANQAVYIEDKLTNTVFDLKTGAYTFTTKKGTFNDRFVLRYADKTLGTNDLKTIENQVLVANNNQQIKVNSIAETIDKVTIYDLLGRLIYQKNKVNNSELIITNLAVSKQALLIKVILQNGNIVTKKIIY